MKKTVKNLNNKKKKDIFVITGSLKYFLIGAGILLIALFLIGVSINNYNESVNKNQGVKSITGYAVSNSVQNQLSGFKVGSSEANNCLQDCVKYYNCKNLASPNYKQCVEFCAKTCLDYIKANNGYKSSKLK